LNPGKGFPPTTSRLVTPSFGGGWGEDKTKTPDRFLKPVRCNEVENKKRPLY